MVQTQENEEAAQPINPAFELDFISAPDIDTPRVRQADTLPLGSTAINYWAATDFPDDEILDLPFDPEREPENKLETDEVIDEAEVPETEVADGKSKKLSRTQRRNRAKSGRVDRDQSKTRTPVRTEPLPPDFNFMPSPRKLSGMRKAADRRDKHDWLRDSD